MNANERNNASSKPANSEGVEKDSENSNKTSTPAPQAKNTESHEALSTNIPQAGMETIDGTKETSSGTKRVNENEKGIASSKQSITKKAERVRETSENANETASSSSTPATKSINELRTTRDRFKLSSQERDPLESALKEAETANNEARKENEESRQKNHDNSVNRELEKQDSASGSDYTAPMQRPNKRQAMSLAFDDTDDEMSRSPVRKKRKRWNYSEDRALRRGIREFGLSAWARIKERYPFELQHRTNVNIKVSI